MKYFIKSMILLTVFSLIPFTPAGNTTENTIGKKPSMVLVWETPKELAVPESVMYDAKQKLLYTSNISGKPTLKNGKGFIAKVNLDGSIEDPAWVTGLNAPKGMGIAGETLYVTDIDRVVAIGILTGVVNKIWEVEGAKFLNDIAVDPDEKIFISDMATKRIHVIQEGQLSTFLVLDYERPNGLCMSGNTLLVGTAQGVVTIDTRSKGIAMEIAHHGGIDGIKPLGGGRYIVSDWKGKVQIIEKGQTPVVLMDTSVQKINAADFEYIPEKNLVIIPTFFDDRLTAYQLR
jgi:sugar lactone lactonase YvrE